MPRDDSLVDGGRPSRGRFTDPRAPWAHSGRRRHATLREELAPKICHRTDWRRPGDGEPGRVRPADWRTLPAAPLPDRRRRRRLVWGVRARQPGPRPVVAGDRPLLPADERPGADLRRTMAVGPRVPGHR